MSTRKLQRCRAISTFQTIFLLFSLMIGLINACEDPTTLTAPESPANYFYNIGSGDYEWQIPFWIQGFGCTFIETLTISPSSLPSWINFNPNSRIVTVSTTDTSLHGTVETFIVTATVNDSGSTSNNDYSFQITLFD